MRFLGLDIGTKTIGLALCDEEGLVATPQRTLPRAKNIEADVQAVAAFFQKEEAAGLVIGLPLDLSGREGPMVRIVRQLGEALRARLDCPVHYFDERFSTAMAEKALLEGDVRRSKRKEVRDHLAAALILQAFLDAQRSKAAQLKAQLKDKE